MPSGPHLTQLCVALSRLQSVYCPRDRELLAEYATIQGRSIDDTAERMIALSRGLVLKIYTQTIRSDQKWSHQEQELGAYILCEFWGQQLDGEAFRTAWARLMSDSIKLTWDSLLTPFIHCRSLSHLRSEVFTTAMHIANLFAKCDGLIDPEETQTILQIEHELDRLLFESPPSKRSIDTLKNSSPNLEPNSIDTVRSSPHVESSREAAGPSLDESLLQLQKLIGLEAAKKKVQEIASFLRMQQQRKQAGLPVNAHALHMTFSGNPGTGKTTVARIVAHILRGLGILKRGHLVETDRSGLIAEYAGQTATKCNKKIDEALDGVLFIDEAYSLVDESGDDAFGREAIQTLLKRMEDNRDRLIVILAGYTAPLENLLRSNPGLTSRIGANLDFPDYSPNELMAIYRLLCKEHQYVLRPEAEQLVFRVLYHLHTEKDEHFGNGRTVRNIFELAIRRMAVRIASISPVTRELLTRIEKEDIALPGGESNTLDSLANTEMLARFKCPNCQKRITGADALVLQEVPCPACKTKLELSQLRDVEWSVK